MAEFPEKVYLQKPFAGLDPGTVFTLSEERGGAEYRHTPEDSPGSKFFAVPAEIAMEDDEWFACAPAVDNGEHGEHAGG